MYIVSREEGNKGLEFISFVEHPATKMRLLKVGDTTVKAPIIPIMQEIERINDSIVFPKETVDTISDEMDNAQYSFEHDHKPIKGVTLKDKFIEKDILYGIFEVDNTELLTKIEKSTITGVSIEGDYTLDLASDYDALLIRANQLLK